MANVILDNVDWRKLAREIRTEVKNREIYSPLVSVYRWWARRPSSLVAALLDAADLSSRARVSDPFSGGGTVAIEAARRGFAVYAQDINPWAAWGLSVSLTPVDPVALAKAGNEFLEALRHREEERYSCDCDEHASSTALHTFRVRSGVCRRCGERAWQFPYPMMTLASRASTESHAFYGCKRCGSVSRHRYGCGSVRCNQCGALLEREGNAAQWFESASCPHCKSDGQPVALGNASWRPVLVQRLCATHSKHFDLPTESERCGSKAKLPVPALLDQPIPAGLETSRLIRSGFRLWRDLYPRRQLEVLLSGAKLLKDLALRDESIRNRLGLCLVGATEMAGHLCRWDRYHPKVFEALANHRYAFDGLAVEPNPLCHVGRGSLERRIRASTLAAKWLAENIGRKSVSYFAGAPRRRRPVRQGKGICVAQGSSGKQLLPKKSVSLVITDPPYFDSVQYGELSSLFITWIQGVTKQRQVGSFDRSKEAVPNRVQGRGVRNYQTLLTSILKECARTMRPRGRLVLTYHSTNLRAWACLGDALAKTGFHIVGLAVARTENGDDHSKRGTRAFVTDLVIECRLQKPPMAIHVPTEPRRPEERELLHVGHAIAEAGGKGYQRIREAFLRRASRMRTRRIDSPCIASSKT